VISKDGGTVGFVSLADDLVTPDTNGATDVFAADLKNSFLIQPVNPVNESDGTVTVTVARTGSLGTSDTVEVKTGDGFDTSIAPNPFPGTTQATQPGDYTQTDKTLSFPPGVATQTFTIPIEDDLVAEGAEAFHISLSGDSGAVNVPGPGPLSYAYVEILDNDGVTQDWSATNTTSPAGAAVGDTVQIQTTITAEAGADDLSVTALGSGAGTAGLGSITYDNPPLPFTVPQGTSTVVTGTATVTAAPGTAGVELQTSVQGQLGAATAIRTAESGTITVGEAVSGVLSGAPATVGLSDQYTYTLTLTNSSDTPAQLVVPALTAPTGTSEVSHTDCATTLAAGASTSCDLEVDVDDGDADLTTITGAPAGVTYAMPDISLPARPVTVAPVVSAVHAPVVAVSNHTLTDVDGGTLQPADSVHVSVTVDNTGHAGTTATLADTLTGLVGASGFQVDGAACTCAFAASAVTAAAVDLPAGGSAVMTFDALVPVGAAAGDAAGSSVVATFTGATTGTSPTLADVKSLTVGSANQDWHVTITQQPPASAEVGDTVTAKATVTVDAGLGTLSVSAVGSGAATNGLDQVVPSDTTFTVNGGDTQEVTVPARVVAAPGTGGVALEVTATGALGADPSGARSDTTDPITVEDAVAATLTGGPATVTTADQITYQVTFANSSDTAVQATGLGTAMTAPAGTTATGPATGPVDLAPNSTNSWTLVVNVDDADVDGQALTFTPGAITYAMTAIPALPAQPVTATPASSTSTVGTPDTTKPDVTIDEAAAQADPTSDPTIHFTAVFSEPVTGFDSADVSLGASTAGGPLTTVVTGGPSTYDVAVSGMTQTGDVVAAIPTGGAQDGSGNPSTASTSADNTVHWVKEIASHVAVATTPGSTVFGQSATATATVTFDSGTSAGSVQFSVDGADVGSPVTVSGGTATSAPLAGLEPGARSIGATFTPADPVYLPASGSSTLSVSKATTQTTVTVGASTVAASVAAVAPGAGAPSGTVTFQVNGSPVGTANVGAGGVATLAYTVPSSASADVGAAYAGDTHFTASSGSTARTNPAITAKVTSAQAQSKFGWYRTPVKVTFTCTPNGSPLTAPCPDAVTVNKNGAGQSVTRTITAQDGGTSTATANGLDIDQAAPLVSVGGVTNGGRYPSPGPKPTCVGKDALSGVAACVIHTHRSGGALSTTVRYTLRAVDKAGNVTTKKGTYSLSGIGFKGAPFKNGAYTMHLGQTYLLVVSSAVRPDYLDAAPYPHKPFKVDPFPFRSAGHHLWSVPILMEPALAVHTYWNVGVVINGTVTVIKIRVLP
jgi:hypothetical protein